MDLAYINIMHWQSQSDQDNILHVARAPILFGKGIPEGTVVKIGVDSEIICNAEGADFKFVEHINTDYGLKPMPKSSLRLPRPVPTTISASTSICES